MPRDTEPKDYSSFLQDLDSADQAYFLEGGQSVNFWANYFRENGLADPSLDNYQPFTSKDCDIWVSNPTLQYIKIEYGELMQAGTNPADGQLGVLNLGGNPELRIDLLSNVFGLSIEETGRALQRSLNLKGIRVLDPVFLFRSKCHCLVNLNQIGRQDRKHVDMLTLILPSHFHGLLDAVVAGGITERQLIKEVKLLLSFRKDKWVRKALGEIQQELDSMIPIGLLKKCGQPTIEAFIDQKWG